MGWKGKSYKANLKVAKEMLLGKKAKVQPPPVIHGPIMYADIKSGQCTPAPPLGPNLGQRGLNVAQVCKEFNERTSHMIEGVPLKARIHINADRSYRMEIGPPTDAWMLMHAAGIRRASMYPTKPKDMCGKITPKHIYEIAKVKATEEINVGAPLDSLFKELCYTARKMGLKVVRTIDPVEYKDWLINRKAIVEQQLQELEEKKAAQLLRSPSST